MPNVELGTGPDVSEKMAELGMDVITEFGETLDDWNLAIAVYRTMSRQALIEAQDQSEEPSEDAAEASLPGRSRT